MPATWTIIDFADAAAKRLFLGYARSLDGPFRVSIRKCRPVRSLNQNAFLWGVVYPCVVAGLEEAWGETMDVEDAHEFCKAKFNYRTVVNKQTGEVQGHLPQSTAGLDVAEFSVYLDRVIKLCQEELGVEVPLPNSLATGKD